VLTIASLLARRADRLPAARGGRPQDPWIMRSGRPITRFLPRAARLRPRTGR